MMRTWSVGRRFGLRVDTYPGPWVSLGVHVHVWPADVAHADLHIGWWLVTVGRHYSTH